jgi:hypothetical protein
VASEVWPEIDSGDPAHRNVASYVQLLAQDFLDLNQPGKKKGEKMFDDSLSFGGEKLHFYSVSISARGCQIFLGAMYQKGGTDNN